MKKILFVIVLFLSAAGMMVTHSIAELTQWTDDKGIVHFTDKPVNANNSSNIKTTDEVPTPLLSKSGESILQMGKVNFTKTLGMDHLSMDQAESAFKTYNETIEAVYKSRLEALLAVGLEKKALDLQSALLQREQYYLQLSAIQDYQNTITKIHADNISKRKAKTKELTDLVERAQALQDRIRQDLEKKKR